MVERIRSQHNALDIKMVLLFLRRSLSANFDAAPGFEIAVLPGQSGTADDRVAYCYRSYSTTKTIISQDCVTNTTFSGNGF